MVRATRDVGIHNVIEDETKWANDSESLSLFVRISEWKCNYGVFDVLKINKLTIEWTN